MIFPFNAFLLLMSAEQVPVPSVATQF